MYTICQSEGKIRKNHIACKLRICRWRRILPNCKLPHITYPCRLLINVCQIAVSSCNYIIFAIFLVWSKNLFPMFWITRKKSKIKCTKYALDNNFCLAHGQRTPSEDIAFTARPKINSHSKIFRYGGRSICCLPHLPEFLDFFDLCLHWVSIVRDFDQINTGMDFASNGNPKIRALI